ncbi:MAG TPA: hypothetical protein VHX62_02620 [Solirubrobacteraceae bacterium]|nr:hypothetical protein [Solirubrobacteraceae bacterium]
MSFQPDYALTGRGGVGTGAQQLAAISSFGGEERLRLPFNLQRRHLFLFVVAIVAMAAVAIAAGVKPILGAGMIVAVAAAFAVALNEMLGLILLAALAAATSGLARGIPVPGIRFSEVLIGGIGIVLLTTARKFVRWSTLDWLALLYCVATFALGAWDLLSQGEAFNSGEIQLLLGPCQFLLLYRATLVTARTPERRRLALRLIIGASVPVALLAIGQQFNFPGVRSLLVTLTGTNFYAAGSNTARATGPFPLWHNLGGYLLMVLLAIIAVQTQRVEGIMSRRTMLLIAALDAVALVETLDLAPLAALVAGILIIGIWLGGLNRVLIGTAVVLVVGMLVFGGRLDARFSSEFGRAPGTARSSLVPQTIQYRFDLWTGELLPLLKGHVATGYGPTLPAQIQNFPYTESQYINLLYRGGVVLLSVWAALFIAMGFAGVRAARDADPFQRALGVAVATAVICLVFMQVLEAYFVDDGTPQVLWMLLGLLAFHDVPSARALDRAPAFDDPANRRAWAANVAMAFETLDPSTQELLRLAYSHQMTTPELVSVMGLNADAINRWQSSAMQRLALHANMAPAAAERLLRSGTVPLGAW